MERQQSCDRGGREEAGKREEEREIREAFRRFVGTVLGGEKVTEEAVALGGGGGWSTHLC